jgi:hypothetical protein
MNITHNKIKTVAPSKLGEAIVTKRVLKEFETISVFHKDKSLPVQYKGWDYFSPSETWEHVIQTVISPSTNEIIINEIWVDNYAEPEVNLFDCGC